MYQARFAAHSRSNSDLNRNSFGSDSTGRGGSDGCTGRFPPGGFRDVDATCPDSPAGSQGVDSSDSDADVDIPIATSVRVAEGKYSMSRAARRKFEADRDRGNQESSRAARGHERLAEGVAERVAEQLGTGDHRLNGHGRSRLRGYEIEPLTDAAPTASARTGLESNELSCKIEEIDAKIERLQAKRAKYASRLDKLQGKMEKLAGPIQWSASQNLTRMQQGTERTPEK